MKVYSKKIIVVADKLQDMGGGEIVLSQICEALKPEMVITTSANDKYDWCKFLGGVEILTPFWGRFVTNRYVWFLFYPIICLLMRKVSVYSDKGVFVYSSSASKFIKAESRKKVILYSNFPARGVFFPGDFFKSRMVRFFIQPLIAVWRDYEIGCVKRYKDIYVISQACRKEYKKLMNVESTVLNCPTDNRFSEIEIDNTNHIKLYNNPDKNYSHTFVLVSRLVDWKGLDYVFEYFESQSIFNLKIIGDGALFTYYRKKFNKNCSFLGYLETSEKISVMRSSYALIFPSIQEWSLVTIEASSLGVPVLGVKCAATIETQVLFSDSNKLATCLTYEKNSCESLSAAMYEFISIDWDADFICQHSKKYSPREFRKKIKEIIVN
jgi:glycosyltransferase involved in cell wall biosynthesis